MVQVSLSVLKSYKVQALTQSSNQEHSDPSPGCYQGPTTQSLEASRKGNAAWHLLPFDTFAIFLISSRAEDAEPLLGRVSSAPAEWVKKPLMKTQSAKGHRCHRGRAHSPNAASRVHGSMEVLQAVLLLLPPSLEERQQAGQGQA